MNDFTERGVKMRNGGVVKWRVGVGGVGTRLNGELWDKGYILEL